MQTDFSLKKIEQSYRRFIDYSSDLLNSNYHTFNSRFDSFVYFCENDDVMKIITAKLKIIDVNFDDWWERGQKTGGSMVGSKQFRLPVDELEKDALLYQLILKISKNEIKLMKFCVDYFGATAFDEMIQEFNNAVLQPLIRSIGYRLDDMLDSIKQELVRKQDLPQIAIIRKEEVMTDFIKQRDLSSHILTHEEIAHLIDGTDINDSIVFKALEIASQINQYGYEGKSIGTTIIIGDYQGVERNILKNPTNPFQGISGQILEDKTAEYVRRYAGLDGALVITGDGFVKEAGAIISADLKNISIAGGARHLSAAAITRSSNSISIVVSQSGGIRIFKNGEEIKKS